MPLLPIRPWAALALAAALATLSACGGGDGPAVPAAATTEAAVAATLDGSRTPALDPLRRRVLAAPASTVPAAEAARQLMDVAEAGLPQYFPGPASTVHAGPFEYRFYPATGVYLVVVIAGGTPFVEQGVYVLGGAFGEAPLLAGLITDFITPVNLPITMSLGSDRAVVQQGGISATAITLTRADGFVAGAEVTVSGLPAGVTARTLAVAEGATTATLVLDAQPTAPHSLPTTATLSLRAAGTVFTRSLTVTVRGAAGTPDTSFGGGVITTPVGVSEDYANAVAVQADGKVLVAGSTATNQGTQFSIVRHLRDGGLDPAFGQGGKVVLPMGTRGNDGVAALAVQPDGRILLAGSSDQGASGMDFALLRLLPNGQVDPSFGTGGKLIVDFFGGTDRARAIALLPDGRIVVGGEAHSGAAGGLDFALLRLSPDGVLDTSFGQGGRVVTAIRSGGSSELIRGLALPVVGGEQRILAVGGEGDFMAVRYRANGALDTSFGAGGKVAGLFNANIGSARAVTLTPDGKAVLIGHIGHRFAAARLDVNGQLDTSFGTAGRFEKSLVNNWNEATAVALQADGKLVLGGWAYAGVGTSGDFAALRLTANGQIDTGFGDAGVLIRSAASGTKSDQSDAMVLQVDDRVPTVRAILAGEASSSNYDFALMRLWL